MQFKTLSIECCLKQLILIGVACISDLRDFTLRRDPIYVLILARTFITRLSSQCDKILEVNAEQIVAAAVKQISVFYCSMNHMFLVS